jgi:hypothetical protein
MKLIMENWRKFALKENNRDPISTLRKDYEDTGYKNLPNFSDLLSDESNSIMTALYYIDILDSKNGGLRKMREMLETYFLSGFKLNQEIIDATIEKSIALIDSIEQQTSDPNITIENFFGILARVFEENSELINKELISDLLLASESYTGLLYDTENREKLETFVEPEQKEA